MTGPRKKGFYGPGHTANPAVFPVAQGQRQQKSTTTGYEYTWLGHGSGNRSNSFAGCTSARMLRQNISYITPRVP